MSLLDDVKELEGSLPTKVHEFLTKLAGEVETHKQLLSDLGGLAGVPGETAATAVEEGATLFESTQPVTPAPTEPSTSGESEVKPSETESTQEAGNPEQQPERPFS